MRPNPSEKPVWLVLLLGPIARCTVRLLTKVIFTVQPCTRNNPSSEAEAELCIRGVMPRLFYNFYQRTLRTLTQAGGGSGLSSLKPAAASTVSSAPGLDSGNGT